MEIKEKRKHFLGKLQTQLVLSYMIVVALFAGTVCVFFYQYIVQSRIEREARLLSERVNTQYKSLSNKVATVEHDAIAIPYNNTISDYLVYPYSSDAERIKDALNSFQPMLRWMLSINSQYRRIHFLVDSEENAGGAYVSSSQDYKNQMWYMKTKSVVGKCLWRNSHFADSFAHQNLLKEQVATCSLYWIANYPYMIILDVSLDWMYADCELVIDSEDGKILYSTLPQCIDALSIEITHGETIDTAVINNNKYFVCSRENTCLGVTVLACSDQNEINREIREQMFIFSLLILGMVLLTAMLLCVISRSVVVRMRVIGRNVNRVTNGDYKISYKIKNGDEIDDLGNDVVSMAHQMNQMVNLRLNQQMLLREAEFRALQQQINPHFMFNTLQMMQMVAEINDQQELSDMIAHFGNMVRYNLLYSVDVPLSDEIANVKDYIILQRGVMNDELIAEFVVDDGCTAIEVPRLLLQPLVENAIIHGKISGVTLIVRLSVFFNEHGCCVKVFNNGKPADEEQLVKIQRELKMACENLSIVDGCNASHNLALINIQKRLMIRFGAGCCLTVANVEGGGFEVSFTIGTEEKAS